MNKDQKTARKRILFIIPPYFYIEDCIAKSHICQKSVFTIPYGVLSLAAYVKAHAKFDTQIEIIDLNFEAAKLLNAGSDISDGMRMFIESKMLEFKPNIVGISALFNTCYSHLDFISHQVKKKNHDVLLVIGGGLATNLYQDILLRFESIDACCYGEGEIPLSQLVNAENPIDCLNASASWITRESLRLLKKPEHRLVQDLDEIPSLDFGLINLDDYQGRSLDKTPHRKHLREISIHTSRGCPFNCVFCANASVHGKRVRYMSVARVIAEIKSMISQYHIKILLIEDDHFLSNINRAKEILGKISHLHLKVEFPNGMAVYAIDEEIGRFLRDAGVGMVTLAVESGSDYVLEKIIRKQHRVDMIQPAVEILRKNGISVNAFIIVGLPGELEAHREETMKMIMNVGFDWVTFSLATPVVVSRLYTICKEKGYLIDTDYSRHITTKANIRTPDIDPEYIEDKVYLMNLEANFIHNYDLRIKDFRKARVRFKNIIKKYPEHAFAYYCLAKAYEGLGLEKSLVRHNFDRAWKIISANDAWARYARHFGLRS